VILKAVPRCCTPGRGRDPSGPWPGDVMQRSADVGKWLALEEREDGRYLTWRHFWILAMVVGGAMWYGLGRVGIWVARHACYWWGG
jgi:hypothetical protein